ncbi:MAG: group 1 glycosyl transferase [Ramlibacter sp.]|jgi:glycosyltransferase involved in cell wall biosynthesis|nr:group 1 glycosyl transferase [Ramlibacter sp.]
MLSSVIGEMIKQGGTCRILAMRDGQLVNVLEGLGATVSVLGSTAPPNYKHGRLALLRSAFSLLQFNLRTVRRTVHWLKASGGAGAIVRMPNLVPLAAFAGCLARVPVYWIMPNAVSNSYFLHLNKVVYELLVVFCRLRVIANSAYTASTLLNWFRPPQILHLGVNSNEFPNRAINISLRRSMGIKEDSFVIGIFARLIEEKGQEALIRALPTILSKHPSVVAILVGGGETPLYEAQLENLAEEIGVRENVVFAGPRADVSALYGLCDFTASLRITPEPFGLSIIESMMAGRPVLANAAGAPGETIIDGRTGWLIPEVTPESVAQGVTRAMEDVSKWNAMGACAAEHARDKYDVSVVVRNLRRMLPL